MEKYNNSRTMNLPFIEIFHSEYDNLTEQFLTIIGLFNKYCSVLFLINKNNPLICLNI